MSGAETACVGDGLFADSRLVVKSKGCLVAGNAVLFDRKQIARLVLCVCFFSFEKNIKAKG